MEESTIGEDNGNPVHDLVHRTIRNTRPKFGRNSLCVCGSGKKWKRCHLIPAYRGETGLIEKVNES